ncbi:MAG TPA: hypothetical protein VF981_12580 [Gemmatimonadaceae bacterium]
MRHRTVTKGSNVRWLAVAALAFGTASIAPAQSSHLGARIGYDFDSREVLLSTNLTVPVSQRVEFYPSIDVYTPDRGSKLGFNGDFKVRFPVRSGPEMYLGGGLGVLNRSVGDFSRTDVGANMLFGMESRIGRVHPFGEARIHLNDGTSLRLIGGLNFTLGGP